MARNDAVTGSALDTRQATPPPQAFPMNETVMDLALDCRDYYGDNELAADVLRSKYLAPNEQGPMHLWDRIARAVASVETANREEWQRRFLEILFDFTFVPGGRVMHGAGREDARRRPTLSNCYVIPIEEDSLEGIYRCLSESAMVYRTGGGVGTDLSALRPEGAPVNATIDHSPGATAFMNLFSESTNTVSQAGRRGALMLTMRVDHPDIEHFITIKNDVRRTHVQHANISVLITHEFMDAVTHDRPFDLRWNSKTYRTVNARELWFKIVKNAHASAEPGIIFWDTMRDYHNVEYANPLTSTNPCGEQPLASYTACNLGNINLCKFVGAEGQFDYARLAEVTRVATRFMDNIIDYNMENHALEKIKKAVASDRRIGLGITGLADALLLMKIRYDSQAALDETERIMQIIRDEAYRTSVALAREKGAFPLFQWEGYSRSKFIQALPPDLREDISKYGIRNSTVLTVPPVGTGSIVAQTSSGIEPIFCTSYRRRVKNHDGETFSEYKVFHPLVKKLFGDDVNLPDYVVTAHDIDPYFRVKMQGIIQKYVDSSISSTVNLAEDVSVETVGDIYLTAYKAGLKGITVYREGSREGILQTEEFARKQGAQDATKAEPRAPKGPRQRPVRTHGVTERVKTGEGYLYVTINEDESGMCEVFTTIGKAGGNAAAQSEAISRLISLALRSGIEPREVVKQLKGISGPTSVWDGQGGQILSTPDAIGKVLERYLDERDEIIAFRAAKTKKAKSHHGASHQPAAPRAVTVSTCPECGSTVEHVSGCVVCYQCGWSKC
ncbi:MAG: adenosylcobalamin-dependent ribonucleoside-diphosphate reductase [Bacteroidetes bacterium]|nr:adenosylcobalamin-dependent ribonucleoside-diphosphate reductase [Bacteroidota bacterium]